MQLTLRSFTVSDEQFDSLIRSNPEWKFEQTENGELIVVQPTGGTSGRRNRSLTGQLNDWVEANLHLGEGFDSSTLFILPSGAKRSPDASWVRREAWDALTQKQQDGYVPLCPDFVVELRKVRCGGSPRCSTFSRERSPTDELPELRSKMQEYINNGTRLGWLINPQDRQVETYRQQPNQDILYSPQTLSGEDVLPGFVLRLERIWD